MSTDYKRKSQRVAPKNSRVQRRGDGEDHLADLFQRWRQLDERQAAIASKTNITTEDESECDQIERLQSVILSTAAVLPGVSDRDILHKLAFWRWVAPELEDSLDRMLQYEAMAYSAFRDMVERTGETEVMTETDMRTEMLRFSEVR